MAPPIPPKNPARPPPIAPLKPKKESMKRVRKAGTTSTSNIVQEALSMQKSANAGPSVEDYQDMSRVEASMELFNANVEGNLAAVHSEIKTRVESGEGAAQADDAARHLKEELPTPPSSPESPLPPTGRRHRASADLNASQERRIKLHQDLLKNETFGGLLRRDAYFHGLMNDLDGLREWWDQTRTEWRNRREEMIRMEKTLTVLATQRRRTEAQLKEKYMTGHKRSAKNAELGRLNKQYARQATQIHDWGLWFGKTRELMDGVKLRFKQLEIESKDAEIESWVQNTVEDEFEYILDGINAGKPFTSSHHPQLPPWWRGSSPLWWLDQAIIDLSQSTQEIKVNREVARAIKDECDTLILDTQRDKHGLAEARAEQVKEIEYEIARKELEMAKKYGNNQERRASLDHEVKLLYGQRRVLNITIRGNLWAKDGVIKALEEEREMQDADVRSLRRRLSRMRVILRLARETRSVVSTMFEEGRESAVMAPEFVAGLSIVHDICCVEDVRNTFYKQLRNVIQNSELPFINKKNLSVLQESHFERFQAVHQSLLGFSDKDVNKEKMFYKIGEIYQFLKSAGLEMSELQQIVLEVDEILGARQLVPAEAVDPNLTPDRATFIDDSSQKNRKSWEKTKSVDDARRVLDEPDSRGLKIFSGNKTLGAFLREFFTSPDIAPNFENMSRLTKEEFFDLVDTFVDDDYSFTPRELEAFLVYGDYTGELFKLDGKYVSPSKDGWELVDESPVGGPPRKMSLVEPLHAEEFGAWMVRDHDMLLIRLRLQDDQRDTHENALLYVTKKYNPYKLNDDDLQSLFAYYSQTGIYFRYLPTISDEGQPILRRIDNGWNVDPKSKLRALFSSPKDFFIPIRREITSTAAKSILEEARKQNRKFNEAELYAYLQNGIPGGLKFGGLWGIGQTQVTKHKFHLFLRWCDQFNDLFELNRDGSVNVNDSGWDQGY